jgi:hypothetical protein
MQSSCFGLIQAPPRVKYGRERYPFVPLAVLCGGFACELSPCNIHPSLACRSRDGGKNAARCICHGRRRPRKTPLSLAYTAGQRTEGDSEFGQKGKRHKLLNSAMSFSHPNTLP